VDEDPVTEAGISVTAGAVTTNLWCRACKAFTVLDGEVWALTRTGLALVGTWQWCEVCQAPGDQDQTRRTGRA
jgi:hypothetical protein